jgi:hypothetical protein
MYNADAQMEAQARVEEHERTNQGKRDEDTAKASEQNAQGVQAEVQALSQQSQQDPNHISIPNLILVLTQRFARLASLDRDEFKIRMLAMKNSTPSLYRDIYGNLKEMNVILLDTMPDLEAVSKYTPGQIPSVSQGDTYGDQPTSPAEAGADTGIVAEPEQRPLSVQPPLPEQRPPRSPSAGI